jgi:hypothetical protein
MTAAEAPGLSYPSAPAARRAPDHAGIASAVNNDVARFGGLLAVAILPVLAGITGTAYLHPDALAAGFRTDACFLSCCAPSEVNAEPRSGGMPDLWQAWPEIAQRWAR